MNEFADERQDFEPDADLTATVEPGLFREPDLDESPGDLSLAALMGSEKPAPEASEERFPLEIEQELQGLLYLGALVREFELFGHKFVLRTLKTDEELACTLVVKRYEETLGLTKALGAAYVAASLVTVDGRKLIQPIGPEQTITVLRQRFEYVTQNWYWPVIETIYDEYSELTLRQAEVFDALEGKSRASRPTS